MKIRNGFVSNSSSSSFVIQKQDITEEQIDKIKNHIAYSDKKGWDFGDDEWEIYEDEECISGSTIVDNFNMKKFLKRIGVKKIEWEGEENSSSIIHNDEEDF